MLSKCSTGVRTRLELILTYHTRESTAGLAQVKVKRIARVDKSKTYQNQYAFFTSPPFGIEAQKTRELYHFGQLARKTVDAIGKLK